MNTLREQVEQAIRKRALFRRGQAILVAVSGGVDSMVLLHVLHALAPKHGWQLTVAHFNHRLRGRSSDGDERLVRSAAKKLGLRFVGRRADVKKLARAKGISIEMAARKPRHEFLARAAARLNIRTVALAHHADDQVELFFLRLLRGAGNEGLAGMKWRSASPAGKKVELVRPLLEQPKTSLREYACANRIRFREDATNASRDFLRNRIRHQLLPLLRRNYQPALERTVLRLMDIAGAEAEFVSRAAAQWLESRRRTRFAQLPVAVQRRCVQLQLLSRKLAPDYELVEKLRTETNRPATIAPDLSVVLGPDGQLRVCEVDAARPDLRQAELNFDDGAGELTFCRLKIQWLVQKRRLIRRPKFGAGRELFDADKVGNSVVLRHWHSGDRFQPIGMPAPVKLQDLFTNLKIPRVRRHELVVATTRTGELFWVENLRIAERFKLCKSTIRSLLWQWKQL